jgi:hypothetical protein
MFRLAQRITQAILRWANMLNRRLKVGALYVTDHGSTFLTQLSRVWLSLFPMLI